MYRKNIVYVVFGTLHGFRCPLGVLATTPVDKGGPQYTLLRALGKLLF